MAKQADHYRSVPKNIFVVATDESYRIYTAEGHAINWFTKQAEKGLKPTMIKYAPEQQENTEKVN